MMRYLCLTLPLAYAVVMRYYNKVNFEEYKTKDQLLTLFDENQHAKTNIVGFTMEDILLFL